MKKIVQNAIIKMEQELIKKEQDMAKQYWDMIALLIAVLNHNHLVGIEYQDNISFYTKTGIYSAAEELSRIWDYG